ncbi:MAG: oxaloacetate decarboxylase subunit alpha [Eubacterium sp.]|nr:oxaloacetate decarboxylase subunit alpha [Eubacterium sp.]
MADIEKKPVKITETVLRDAHQSLIATRMTTEQMLPIAEKLDQVGYHAIECWGGATFDACLRFLKEDPWERLRKLRDKIKNTKLQMLFRGQNILGYNHYADDVVEYFVQKSVANGIDIIRIFDCLNDIRNLETAVKAANKEKAHAQIALSYTLGDAYTLDYWKDISKKIEDMGANSLCIKDMAGLLTPYNAAELVTALKEATSLPIELHTHYTSGVASMTYLKAVEAGCDIIDTAMSPFALGTSQPATEVMVETFRGTPYDTGFDQELLSEIADYFRPMREEALESGLMSTKVLGVNINTLRYQVPGGMLSNLVSQLKEMGQEDKFREVLEEVPRVRKDFGDPPLVTPSSQIVGTQAVLNVVTGERYKMVTKESKKILSGEFGQTVKPFDPEVQKKCIGDTKPITCRPADLIEPQLKKLEEEMKQYKQQDEDVLSYALFPQVATEFFKYRETQRTKVDPTIADTDNKVYPV